MDVSAPPSAARPPYRELLADDLLLIRTGGTKSLAAHDPSLARMEALLEAQGRIFVIVEFTPNAPAVSPSQREPGSTTITVDWVRACVYVNAPFHVRMALKLAAFLAKEPVPSAFVSSVDEALEAVSRFREAGRAATSSATPR